MLARGQRSPGHTAALRLARCCSSIPPARCRTSWTRPTVPLCSLAGCRTRRKGPAKPRTGWKETSFAACGGLFPCNSRCETGSSAPPPRSLVPTPPKLHSAPAPAETRRRSQGKPKLPGAPRSLPRPHAGAGGDTKRRARRQPARERPRRRDPLTETWPGFKA